MRSQSRQTISSFPASQSNSNSNSVPPPLSSLFYSIENYKPRCSAFLNSHAIFGQSSADLVALIAPLPPSNPKEIIASLVKSSSQSDQSQPIDKLVFRVFYWRLLGVVLILESKVDYEELAILAEFLLKALKTIRFDELIAEFSDSLFILLQNFLLINEAKKLAEPGEFQGEVCLMKIMAFLTLKHFSEFFHDFAPIFIRVFMVINEFCCKAILARGDTHSCELKKAKSNTITILRKSIKMAHFFLFLNKPDNESLFEESLEIYENLLGSLVWAMSFDSQVRFESKFRGFREFDSIEDLLRTDVVDQRVAITASLIEKELIFFADNEKHTIFEEKDDKEFYKTIQVTFQLLMKTWRVLPLPPKIVQCLMKFLQNIFEFGELAPRKLRIFFFSENSSICDFLDSINEDVPFIENPPLLSKLLFSFFIAGCNLRQNSQLSYFWTSLIKQARGSDKTRVGFLKSLSPLLQKYADVLIRLKEASEEPEVNYGKILGVNAPGFNFMTVETLSSVFLGLVCQINLVSLLEEADSLGSSLAFLYETFGIIKDENLKDKIVSFANFLFEKTEFIKKVFYREENIARVFKRGFLDDNRIIFLTFLNYFSENVLKNDEVNYNFRNRFFHEAKAFLESLALRKPCECSVKTTRFLCVFFEKLISEKRNLINCVEIFQTLQNASFPTEFLSEYFSENFIYLITGGVYEALLDLCLVPKFLTRELGLEFCNLTLLLLTKENNTESYFFEKNLSVKLYNLVHSFSRLLTDSVGDRVFPIFFFLNLATKHEFQLIIGQHMEVDKESNLETFFQGFQSKYQFLLNYVRIYVPFFVDILVVYLYEVETEVMVRRFAFSMIAGLLNEAARFSSFLLKEEAFVEKVLLFLRIEKDDFLKKTLVKIVKALLKDNFILKILKAFIRISHYELEIESYIRTTCAKKGLNEQFFKGIVSNPAIKNQIADHENYWSTLRYLILVLKELSKSEENTLLNNSPFAFYFNGASSGLICENLNRTFNIDRFTLILELNAQNLVCPSLSDLLKLKTQKYSSSSTLMTKNVNFKTVNPAQKETEYQPVFLSLQCTSGYLLEFSITTKDNLNHVTIELRSAEGEIVCKESFKYKIEEFKWYNIIITKPSEHKYLKAYINGISIYNNFKSSFSVFRKNLLSVKTISIGTERSNFITGKSNPNPTALDRSFQGLLKSVFLLNSAISENEVVDLFKDSKPNTVFAKAFFLNPFALVNKVNYQDRTRIFSFACNEGLFSFENERENREKDKEKSSFFDSIWKTFSPEERKDSSFSKENEGISVKLKGLTVLERFRFKETLLGMGNIDIFLFLIESVAFSKDFTDPMFCNELVSDVFLLIRNLMMEHRSNEVIDFMKNQGVDLTVHILNMFIQSKGLTLNLFETLISLTRSCPDQDLRYSLFLKLICNFSLFFTSNFAIHDRLLIELKTFLMEDEIFQRFKANLELANLFQSLETFYNLEMAMEFFSSKRETEKEEKSLMRHDSLNCLIIQKHIVHFTDLLQIRNEILEIISSIIANIKTEEILKKEIALILDLLSRRIIGPSCLDYLKLLKSILVKILSKSMVFQTLPVEEILMNLMKLLKESGFRVQSVKEISEVENFNKIKALDEFLAALIELQLIFVWEKKDPHCRFLKAIDYLVPKNLNSLTVQLLLEAIEKFKPLKAHYRLIEILFKRLEFIPNEKVFEILQYIKGLLSDSEEVLRYFLRKKTLRFYSKSLNLSDKIGIVLLAEINTSLIEYIIESKITNAVRLFYEYLAYNNCVFFYKLVAGLNKSLQKVVFEKNLAGFHEKKERVLYWGNMIQYLFMLEEFIGTGYKPGTDNKPLLECLGLFYEGFKGNKLLYMTLPEILSCNNVTIDPKEIWSNLSETPSFFFKNGGLLFSFTNILFTLIKLFIRTQASDHASSLLNLLTRIFILEKESSQMFSLSFSTKSNSSKIKETPYPLKALIEESNARFMRFIVKPLEITSEKNAHLKFAKAADIGRIENRETDIMHYLFSRLLKISGKAQNCGDLLEGVCLLMARVYRLIGAEFVSLLRNIKCEVDLKKIEPTGKKVFDKERFLRLINEVNECKLVFSFSKVKSITQIPLSFEKNEEPSDNVLEFFVKFNELEKPNPEALQKAREEIVPKAKLWFKKTVYLNRRFFQFKTQIQKNILAEKLMFKKEDKILETLSRVDKVAYDQNLRYQALFKETLESENVRELRSLSLWTNNQAKNVNIELWNTDFGKSGLFKLVKLEDTLRRRFFLRSVKNTKVKEYLSEMKYKEKLITFTRKNPNNELLSDEQSVPESEDETFSVSRKKISKTSISYLRESVTSLFQDPSDKSELASKVSAFSNYFEENLSKDIVEILNRKKNKHFLMKDADENKLWGKLTPGKLPVGMPEKGLALEFKHKCFAEKISMKGAVWGQLILLKNSVIFCSMNEKRPEDDPIFRSTLHDLGTLKDKFIKCEMYKQWLLTDIRQLHPHNVNHRQTGFELFTKEGKNYIFNVFEPNILREVFALLKSLNPAIHGNLNKVEGFKVSGLQQRWIEGKISNFEYLMGLNTFAGRSLNDLSQYPVFPWVLTDYHSAELNLEYPLNYRDLSLPIGAMNKQRFASLLERMKNQKAIDDLKPFLYGSHYSNPANILYFMIRLEPFSKLCTQLQSGKFDCADRIFNSIPDCWDSCLFNHSDLKELIPEFFYFPEFLKNLNHFEFGKSQIENCAINDVILPPWAKTPEEFVFRNREALESPIVSQNLHHWIDLIFGYKQQGEQALAAKNLFFSYTYEGETNLQDIKDKKELEAILTQISEFGITPTQMFTSPHPERKLIKSSIPDKSNHTFSIFLKTSHPILNLSLSDSSLSVLSKSYSLFLLPMPSKNAVFNKFDILQLREKGFSHAREIKIEGNICQNEQNPFSQTVLFTNNSSDFLIIGGFTDNSFKVFRDGTEAKASISKSHMNFITCIAMNRQSSILVTGGKDCRIAVWDFDCGKGGKVTVGRSSVIYGHNSELTALEVNDTLHVIASVDRDGYVMVHSPSSVGFLTGFRAEKQEKEQFSELRIHDNGLLMLKSKCFLHLYNMNGSFVNKRNFAANDKKFQIMHIEFMSQINSDLLLLNNYGQLSVIDAFSMNTKWDYSLKISENAIPLGSINCFQIQKNKGVILLGFESGNIGLIHLNDEKIKEVVDNMLEDTGFI